MAKRKKVKRGRIPGGKNVRPRKGSLAEKIVAAVDGGNFNGCLSDLAEELGTSASNVHAALRRWRPKAVNTHATG